MGVHLWEEINTHLILVESASSVILSIVIDDGDALPLYIQYRWYVHLYGLKLTSIQQRAVGLT